MFETLMRGLFVLALIVGAVWSLWQLLHWYREHYENSLDNPDWYAAEPEPITGSPPGESLDDDPAATPAP